jgi:hypothetical protein
MCHPHHKRTDDVVKYPVIELRRLKAEHESKFTSIVERIRDSVVDHAARSALTLPTTLQRLADTLGWDDWGDDTAAVSGTLAEIATFCNAIKALPIATRELLVVIVERAAPRPPYSDNPRVLFHEVVQACEMSEHNVIKHVRIMEAHDIASGFSIDDEPYIELGNTGDRPIWSDLRTFCDHAAVELRELIVNLRFGLLDQ